MICPVEDCGLHTWERAPGEMVCKNGHLSGEGEQLDAPRKRQIPLAVAAGAAGAFGGAIAEVIGRHL